MNKVEVTKKVVALIESYGPLPKECQDNLLDYRYLEAGHIDSFAIESLIIQIEDAFNISLPPEDLQSDNFRTPGGIVTIVLNQLSA